MLKTLRKYYWLIEGYVKKHWGYMALGVFLSGFIFYLCFQFLDSFRFARPLKIGIVGNFTQKSIPQEILAKLSRGLTKKTASGQYVEDAAEKISIKNDGLIYEIKLKKNIFWHNGKPFTTADINYNFKDVKFVAKNSREGYFILKNSYAPFLELLSIPLTNENLNGLGNYKVQKIEWEQGFIKTIELLNGDRLIYRFYPSEKIAYIAFRLGEINRIERIADISQVAAWRTMKIEKVADEDRFAAIFFNFKGNSIVAEKSFRQALAYAIDKNSFQFKKAYSSYSAKLNFVYTDSVKKYFFDEAAASNLFKKSVKKPGSVNLTLYCAPQYESSAKQIVATWNRIFKSKFKVKASNGVPYYWQMYLAVAEIPDDPDQYALWHSNKTFYFSGYRNLKVDKLLEDGRRDINAQARKTAYVDLQKTLSEDLPAIFLFYPWKYTVAY